MSTHTLAEKLSLLVDDTQDMGRKERTEALLKFFEKELNLMEQTRYLNKRDLIAIHSRATDIMIGLSSHIKLEGENLYKDERLARAYCVAEAMYEYLRGKGLCSYILKLQTDKGATVCPHYNVKCKNNKYLCDSCGAAVKPILWEALKPKA